VTSRILCIETSTDICSVCISLNGECISIKEITGFKHSSHLLPTIIDLLEEQSLKLQELDAICLSMGPGSYTGLRVGSSTSKGLSYSLDIPLIGINSLHSVANHAKHKLGEVGAHIFFPMIDARRDEVYTAQFDSNMNLLKPTAPLKIDNNFIHLLDKNRDYIICGNGASKVNNFTAIPTNVTLVPFDCSSASLCSLAQDAYLKERFEELDLFEPLYIKPPNITKPKAHFNI